ncbi:putative DNA-binding ribbon-helix-helix protein [Kitasatospora sp. GAS204A]|uniref:hypothetical protein n=1 Tax=unclassified Kitasatospora TaxID=2633591 RepID=UPI00247412F0|nr:hypothetical protein [Kitasatospora sp. GAS204B]MDH6122874.1 putative DNA-binding ribbon-helix-helix protein [Kitasatospora sp. GAS204B]
MGDSTIKVPDTTRDHLAALAKERGMTIGGLVTALAEQQPTAEQLAARVIEGRRVMREHMNCAVTDEEFDSAPDVLSRVYEIAAEKSVASIKKGRAA